MEGGGFLSGIIQCQLASIHNQRQSCWDISENKTIHIPPPPLNSKLGCLLFSTGSLNSGTTLHGMMDGLGGGREKVLFPPFEVSKMSERPYVTDCRSPNSFTTAQAKTRVNKKSSVQHMLKNLTFFSRFSCRIVCPWCFSGVDRWLASWWMCTPSWLACTTNLLHW